MQHNQPHQNNSYVKSLGEVLPASVLTEILLTSDVRLLMARAVKEARVVSVVYVEGHFFFSFFFSPEMQYSCRFRVFQNAG